MVTGLTDLEKKTFVMISLWRTFFYLKPRQVQHFFSLFRKKMPTIVAGDCNEDTRGKAVQWLVSADGGGLHSALSKWVSDEAPTWRWKVPVLGVVKRRYDHILHSREFVSAGASISDTSDTASDHFPVCAKLLLAPDPSARVATPLRSTRKFAT